MRVDLETIIDICSSRSTFAHDYRAVPSCRST